MIAKAPSVLDPKGPGAGSILHVFWLMVGIAAVIYVVTMALFAIGLVRGRREPKRWGDNAFIVPGGLVVPTAVVLVLAATTIHTTQRLTKRTATALHVEVTGYQYWWKVDYPDQQATTANEVHIPAGEPVDIFLTSVDVNHSFWVPQLSGKVDLIPGKRNVMRVRADHAGTYRGFCAEFCGLQHTHMQFFVVADPPDVFRTWVANQAKPASANADPEARATFERLTCAGCHTVRGTAARGTYGPDLTHLATRQTLAAGTVPNDRAHLSEWVQDAQGVKKGALMPNVQLAPADLQAVVTYLESLD